MRKPDHDYHETTRDRDDRLIDPTCAYCGKPKDLCDGGAKQSANLEISEVHGTNVRSTTMKMKIYDNPDVTGEESKKLYIYLLRQNSNQGWDTYDSCVVVAQDEVEARLFHPAGDLTWNGNRWAAHADLPIINPFEYLHEWASPDEVQVTLLGEAIPGAKCGVVCRSFNAA